jgi:hypothetical protein
VPNSRTSREARKVGISDVVWGNKENEKFPLAVENALYPNKPPPYLPIP